MLNLLLPLLLKIGKSATFHAVGVGILIGLVLGWWIWKCPAPKAETYAPAVRQADSSLVLERKPDTTIRSPTIIPKGGKLERVIQVVVAPEADSSAHDGAPRIPADTGSASPPRSPIGLQTPQCPALRVNLALIRMPDGSHRVTASSPDGIILTGVDVPVEPSPAAQRSPPWAIGAAYMLGPNRTMSLEHLGAFVDRDVGPFRIGVSGAKDVIELRGGLRF